MSSWSALPIEAHIARIRGEGEALARSAEAGALDASIPGCPGWDVEALLRHIGDVHRWAATIVRDRLRQRLRRDFEGPAGRDALLGWYREGLEGLIDALRHSSSDDEFWFWGPAPNALAFWARRQANETTIHRCDAESARGAISPLGTLEALDCLDEWLGLIPLRAHAPAGAGRSIGIRVTDGDGAWLVRLAEIVEVTGDDAAADCAVSGPASDLYLWSMNRASADHLTVSGDRGLLTAWAKQIRF